MRLYFLTLLFFVTSGLAMEQRTLLQFNGASETDITKMVESLMAEAIPHENAANLPADLATRSLDKIFEFWVTKQMQPQDNIRLGRIFSLIRHANQPPLFYDSIDPVIPPTSLRELDVLVGSGSSHDQRVHSLAQCVNHTQLHIGYATLARHLVQVKTQKNLQELQRIIQVIRDNRSLSSTIRSFLKELAPLEDIFLSLWPEHEDYLDKFLKQSESKLPFGLGENINSSPFLVELNHLKDFSLRALMPPLAIAAPALCLAAAPDQFATGAAIVSGALTIPKALLGIPDIYKSYKVSIMAFYLMQKKLIAMASFIEKLKNLQSILEDNNVEQILISSLELPTTNPDMKKLLDLLGKKTFKSVPSTWSNWGNICVAYRLMMNTKNEFIRAYLGLGTLDFISSLGSLLDSSSDKTPYCLATYKNGTPSIMANAYWSPLLNPESVVTNDVVVGGNNNPRTIIITGPNAHGKTTSMRSLAGAALLGSTLGIGSAKKLEIPANLALLTSINVGDDPHRNLSLFQATVQRMGTIKHTLEAKARRPHLVIIDEPFVGTDHGLAQANTLTFIRDIAKRANALALLSSHLRVTDLEAEFPDFIANYYLARGYKFSKGISPNPEEYTAVALGIVARAVNKRFAKNVRRELNKNNST